MCIVAAVQPRLQYGEHKQASRDHHMLLDMICFGQLGGMEGTDGKSDTQLFKEQLENVFASLSCVDMRVWRRSTTAAFTAFGASPQSVIQGSLDCMVILIDSGETFTSFLMIMGRFDESACWVNATMRMLGTTHRSCWWVQLAMEELQQRQRIPEKHGLSCLPLKSGPR